MFAQQECVELWVIMLHGVLFILGVSVIQNGNAFALFSDTVLEMDIQ